MKQREAVTLAVEKRRLKEAGERLVRFYEATNRPGQARIWRERLKTGEASPGSAGVK
jgi:hypothetical protein